MSQTLGFKVGRQSSRSILVEVDLIPPGGQGYRIHDFEVGNNQVGHTFIISISVKQLPNRGSDDIRFFLFDEGQLSLWMVNQRAESLILAPSIISADLMFKPRFAGRYHAVLDNKHSTFTSKTVTIAVTEEWLAEEGMAPPGSVETKALPKGKPSMWQKLLGKLRAIPHITSILVFLGIETVVSAFGIAIASYLAPALGLRTGDPWPFIAALAVGGTVIFGIFYFTLTGRPLPLPPSIT